MKRLSIVLAVLMVTSLVLAQEKADVSVAALKVAKVIPGDKEGKLSFGQKGTTLTLVVRRADKFFVGMDGRKTKLASFTDDK